MIIHKQYECEYCGEEFDDEEECLEHEKICDFIPELKRCASCKNGERISQYECKKIKCRRIRNTFDTCDGWKSE